MQKDGPDGTFEYYCDVAGCGRRIFPIDVHVQIPKSTLMGGGHGQRIFVCRQCFIKKFDVEARVFDD